MLISPLPLDSQLSGMRDHVIGYILACGIAHRLNELFSLFDKPQVILNARILKLMSVICQLPSFATTCNLHVSYCLLAAVPSQCRTT